MYSKTQYRESFRSENQAGRLSPPTNQSRSHRPTTPRKTGCVRHEHNSAARSMSVPDTPFVIQCVGCRRVVSDSNSIVETVEQLDAIVLDSLQGARLGSSHGDGDGSSYAPLICTGCQRELGRRYSEVAHTLPAEKMRHGATSFRYVVPRNNVGSYQLGGAKMAHDADDFGSRQPAQAGSSDSAPRQHERGGEADPLQPSPAADDGGAQGHILHLMKVILSMDLRIKRLEEEQPAVADPSDGDGARKRPR